MSEKIKRWMTAVDKRLGRLERSRSRPSKGGGGVINDPDNPLLHLDGSEEFRTASGGTSSGDHWSKIATIQLHARYNDAQLLFTATPRSYGEANRIPALIFARVKQQSAFGSNPYARITIYPGGTHPAAENLRIVVIQNTPSALVEIYIKLDTYTMYGIKPIHVSGSANAVTWHNALESVPNPPTGLISHTATYAQIHQSAVPDTGWRDITTELNWADFGGVLYIRRSGNTVYMYASLAHDGTGSALSFLNYSSIPGFLPTVFNNSTGMAGVAVPWVNDDRVTIVYASTSSFLVGRVSGEFGYELSINYPTDDPWPSTLPGTPA